jgi:hypothetical protein
MKWSVVIPVGPRDEAWQALLPELARLPDGSEIVLVFADALLDEPLPRSDVPLRALAAPRGRARQLNAGAAAARNDALWFLHADSRLHAATLPALDATHARHADALGFFDLRFLPDGPALTALNAVGALLRSRLFGLPFGDQGFFLSRATFRALGGFDERVPYAEDHAFVWAAHRAGVPLVAARAPLYTSARRYAEHGWLATTGRHVRATYALSRAQRRGGPAPWA